MKISPHVNAALILSAALLLSSIILSFFIKKGLDNIDVPGHLTISPSYSDNPFKVKIDQGSYDRFKVEVSQ